MDGGRIRLDVIELLAFIEENQCGDMLNLVLHGQLWFFVDVDLHDSRTAVEFLRQSVEAGVVRFAVRDFTSGGVTIGREIIAPHLPPACIPEDPSLN